MKWFLVVVSLISNHPGGHKDMWVVAKYYESEFDTVVENLSSLIEPIMIVFMGVMIGGLMIAMYSPIFNVGAIIGG